MQCTICGKRFVSEFYLDRHMDNKHADHLLVSRCCPQTSAVFFFLPKPADSPLMLSPLALPSPRIATSRFLRFRPFLVGQRYVQADLSRRAMPHLWLQAAAIGAAQ